MAPPAFLPPALPRCVRAREHMPLRPCRRVPSRICRAPDRRAAVMSQSSPFPEAPSTEGAATSPLVTDAMVSAAHHAADASGEIIRRYFRASRSALGASFKADESPVTLADREAEAAVRAVLAEAFPNHSILGEEGGSTVKDSPYTWIIDPIDGTRAFIAGRPTFGTLIALAHCGVPVLGLIDQPVTGERWVGAEGRGTTLNGKKVCVADDAAVKIANATLQATTPEMFVGLDAIAFRHLRRAVKGVNYGSDCYAFALLASGFGDLVVEADLKMWDFAALVPVVEGAGGVMSDWYGMPITLDSDGRVVAAANEEVHAEALQILQSVDDPHAEMNEGPTPVSEPFRFGNGNGMSKDPGPGHVESMTGFGSAIVGDGNITVGAQLKSVNSRYCDVQVRGPKYLIPFDAQFVALVRQEAVRGKLQLSLDITVEGDEVSETAKELTVTVDQDAAKAVRFLLDEVAKSAGIESAPTIADVLGFSEVLVRRDPGSIAEDVFSIAKRAVREALADLRSARRREGALLEFDLAKRTRKIRDLLTEIEMRAPRRVEKQKERLEALTKDIAEGKVDPMRIEYEVTLYADRADITEEIVRLRAHISLFEMTLLGADEPVGQRLAFLLQEMNREATTIAAKALDAPIAHLGVLMKEEIEKIREQTQNIR